MNQQLTVPNKNEKTSAKKVAPEENKVFHRLPTYTVEPPIAPEEVSPLTPKNPPTMNQNGLYTDPKLL